MSSQFSFLRKVNEYVCTQLLKVDRFEKHIVKALKFLLKDQVVNGIVSKRAFNKNCIFYTAMMDILL